MEFEIGDDPQGEDCEPECDRDGGIADRHRALRNQSSVEPGDYPIAQRRDQRLAETTAGNR